MNNMYKQYSVQLGCTEKMMYIISTVEGVQYH